MPDGFPFWLVTPAASVLVGGLAGLRWLRRARLIEDTPRSRIRSAAQGYVELEGRATPFDGTQNLAPLTRRPCVWWRYRISKKVESGGTKGRRQQWQVVASGESALPFVLDDDTGECVVKPQGAEIVVTETTTWYGHTPWPVAPGAEPRRVLFGAERDYRYSEERIYEHEKLYVLGDFQSTGSQAEAEIHAQHAALLAEWKQDQARLVERFDADRDGRIDPDEWEQARAAARHEVYEAQRDRPRRRVTHVVHKPDGGRLFLIAAVPPSDLARGFRRKAMFWFAGIVATGCALGWVLQHSV